MDVDWLSSLLTSPSLYNIQLVASWNISALADLDGCITSMCDDLNQRPAAESAGPLANLVSSLGSEMQRKKHS